MKKILVTLTVLFLSSCLLFSQEAEEPGTGAELTIIPRLDMNIYHDRSAKESGVDLGNSALYTLFEGNITPDLSFSVSNHWLQASPKELYENTGYSNSNNWVDWAYLRYDFLDHFYVQAGKDILFTGGLESDENDYDMHNELCSSLWNNFPVYQWGATVGWYSSDESTTISAQVATSPLGEKFFSSGMYSFGLQWRGDYGPVQNLWEISLVATEKGKYTPVLSLGQSYQPLDNLKITLDVFNKISDGLLYKGLATHGTVSWYPIPEKLEVLGKVGYEYSKDYVNFWTALGEEFDSDAFKAWVVGGGVQWYPLRDSKDLRIHAIFSHNEYTALNCFNLGVTYYLNFSLFGR